MHYNDGTNHGWSWLGNFPGIHSLAIGSTSSDYPAPSLYALNGSNYVVKWNPGGWFDGVPMNYAPYGGFAQLTVGNLSYLNSTSNHVVGESVFGLANGQIYRLLHGLLYGTTPYDYWVPLLNVPFAPVEIRAGTNVLLATDSANQVWMLASMDWYNYDYGSHLYMDINSSWTQTSLALPSGFQHLAVGGVGDWFLYGPTVNVARYVPNTALNDQEGIPDYDATFTDTVTSFPVLPVIGWSVQPFASIEPIVNVQNRIGCVAPIISESLATFAGFIDWGDTRYKVKETLDDGTVLTGYSAQPRARKCEVVSWCSNTSNPLGMKPVLYDYLYPYSPCSPYYTCNAKWIKVGSSYWGYAYECRGTIDSSKASTCTTYP